jgi:hypothetical protein
MEGNTNKKTDNTFWWIFLPMLIPILGSSGSTKSSSDRARYFLVGRWTYFEPLAKQGEKRSILILSSDGTCTVGKRLGIWSYENGFASIRFGKTSDLRYYELDREEGTLTNHAHDGKTLTKISGM